MEDICVVGIDFGTSTSVMRVKRYSADGNCIGSLKDSKSVTFENGASMVPTLIRKSTKDENKCWYGFDATFGKRETELLKEFKVDLESTNAKKQEQAKELTESFFKYLYKQYEYQRQSGHFGDANFKEVTKISYPVKWKVETREFMLNVARKAGFQNVCGMDEAEAAIRCVLVMCEDKIRNTIKDWSKPMTVMLVDMGAGTTDLVLCKCIIGEHIDSEVLSVWPRSGNVLFGGRELDSLLLDYVAEKIPEDGRNRIIQRLKDNNQVKAWKEMYVSPALADETTVCEFAEVDSLCDIMGLDSPDFSLDRETFEQLAKKYLDKFPKLIKGCLSDAKIGSNEVDLVILTGGHSNWYFVPEILQKKVNFSSGEADCDPIIRTALPQETVAIGLTIEDSVFDIPTSNSTAGSVKEEETPTKSPVSDTFVYNHDLPTLQQINDIQSEINLLSFDEVCAELNMDRRFCVMKKINEYRLNCFLKSGGADSTKIHRKDSILAYYDGTLFESGKNGFLLTNEYLFIKEFGANRKCIKITPDYYMKYDNTSKLVLINRATSECTAISIIMMKNARYCFLLARFFNELISRGIENIKNKENER